VSAYLEKAPTAQLTRINAADRLFSVPLTRTTSVPECAVSSVGFLWGSGTVSRRCGVSVGSPRPLAGSADRRGVPRGRGFRTPMTTFLVTQRHRCHLPACDNSAPIRHSRTFGCKGRARRSYWLLQCAARPCSKVWLAARSSGFVRQGRGDGFTDRCSRPRREPLASAYCVEGGHRGPAPSVIHGSGLP